MKSLVVILALFAVVFLGLSTADAQCFRCSQAGQYLVPPVDVVPPATCPPDGPQAAGACQGPVRAVLHRRPVRRFFGRLFFRGRCGCR